MLPLSGLLFLSCGILLSYFSYHRYTFYKQEPKNVINKYYFGATFCISIAYFAYSLPALLFPRNSDLFVLFTQIATVVNAIGFGAFLLIPAYSWMTDYYHTAMVYIVYLYSLIVGILLILYSPQPIITASGITHWGFQKPIIAPMFGIMALAFVLNIALLIFHFKALRSYSLFNVVALIITFLLAGFGGGYQYIGNNHTLLLYADFALVAGMFIVFIAAVKHKL
jgi:hypothetical protein